MGAGPARRHRVSTCVARSQRPRCAGLRDACSGSREGPRPSRDSRPPSRANRGAVVSQLKPPREPPPSGLRARREQWWITLKFRFGANHYAAAGQGEPPQRPEEVRSALLHRRASAGSSAARPLSGSSSWRRNMSGSQSPTAERERRVAETGSPSCLTSRQSGRVVGDTRASRRRRHARVHSRRQRAWTARGLHTIAGARIRVVARGACAQSKCQHL